MLADRRLVRCRGFSAFRFEPSRVPVLALTAALLAPSLGAPSAFACGVSGPGGAASCSLEEHSEAVRRKWHAAASGVYTSTSLRFDGHFHADQVRSALLASLIYQPTPSLALESGLGASLGGRLDLPDGRHDFAPGLLAAVGASFRLAGPDPFVTLSSLLSYSAASTRRVQSDDPRVNYEAFDARVGMLVGTTLFDVLKPYAVGRAFGGPVFWHYLGAEVTGTDLHHFQLGAGIAALIGRRIDVFVEAIPLGEQALSAGMTAAL
jgi:hypothetical protein